MLNQRFEKRSAKVVVIDPSGPVRQLLQETVRKHGFAAVQAMPSLKDLLEVLEVEPADWIVTSLLAGQEVNALQILVLITNHVELRNTRVTLLVEEAELEVLPAAYENGLLCHFEKPFNKDSIATAFSKFLDDFKECQWDDTKLAASYLRPYLRARKKLETQIRLEKGLLYLFPAYAQCLIEMARPLFEAGYKEQAKGNLRQARLLDPACEGAAEEVAQELFGEKNPAPGDGQVAGQLVNVLGLKTCVVVDPDVASRKAITQALKSLGVEAVHEFEDGESAWDWFANNGDPDLVIQEWRIPKVTGPLLVQRVRKKCPCVPIVAVSSLLTPQDTPLVKEMGVGTVIEKPIDTNDMIRKLLYVIQQDRMPTDAETLETKIRQLLEAGHYEEANKIRTLYCKNTHIPEIRKKKISAEFAYVEKNYPLARDLAVEAIKSQTDSILMLNFLGKCLMKLQDFNAALKCFEKAQTLSPMNVQRLCAIAEASQELGDTAAADKALKRAKGVDKDHEGVAETEATIKISEGQTEAAKAIMDKLQSLANVISFMNNKAVACARSGNFEAGIEIYLKTIAAIPDDKKATQAIVRYNLALAYGRMERLQEAKEQLDLVIALGQTKVLAKSNSLKHRVESAMKNRLSLRLSDDGKAPLGTSERQEGEQETEAIKLHHEAIISSLAANPGDLCCYRVFTNPDQPGEKVGELLATIPNFVKRQAIDRDAVDAQDKAFKDSA